MKRIYVFITAALWSLSSVAQDQDWVRLMNKPDANFYEIQKAFNSYWSDKEFNVPGNGYKAFKRWEYFVGPRVYPSGDLSQLAQTGPNFQAFLEKEGLAGSTGGKFSSPALIASQTWTAIGPMGMMSGVATNGLPRKAGRDNFVTFHPTNINTLWVGAPAGGLWKSTDNGATWTTNTDNLQVHGCSDLAIDPSNTNIMYLATGDGDAGDTRSIGVLKSTDGGTTWNTTGLTALVANNFRIRRLIINPTNPQIIIAATNAGVYRTVNGGTNWTVEANIDCYDLEFKPGDPTVVYAGSNLAFYRSTDSGDNFTQVSTGIPTTGANRLAIAVTSADPTYVYVLRSNTSSGFGGLYRSTTSGTSFSVMSTTPDVLANSCAGTSGGGQGWYDLAIAASPQNKDIVVVGGVNHWRSTNGGSTWTCIGCWNSTVANPPYIHADVHDLEYRSDGVLYSANDGGIYYHTGTAWTYITGTRNIAQIYRIGSSALTANRWMTGHQDNGSNLYTGSAYLARYPGDGMDCFIDRTNDNNLFASTPNGGHVKSTDGGVSWSSANTGITQGGNWVTPWKQDPVSATTLYSGRTAVWKSTNSGTSWTALTATGGSGAIIEFAVAPSNNQVMYVLHSGSIRKTTNGGTSWTAVTGTVPVGSAAPSYIAIKPTDPNTAWVVLSGYSNGNKVFKTTNGGTTWTNISSNLPNLPANCVVYEPGSNDRIYVGMDVGVYVIDNSATNWVLYNTGLPNVPVDELDISPAAPGKLRAATYGRGVWEVDVYSPAPPVTSFSIAAVNYCTNNNIQFNSTSVNGATSWSWSVTPSAGVTVSSFTTQNTSMSFVNAGNYVIGLQASNASGPGNVTTQTVTIIAGPTVNITASSASVCPNSAVTLTASGATTYSWSNGGGTGTSATYSPASTTVYSVTGTSASCSAMKTFTVNTLTAPNVIVNGPSGLCSGNQATISATGAISYTWSTGSNSTAIVVSPTANTTYSVTGTGSNGCKKTVTQSISVYAKPIITPALSSTLLCQGETATLSATGGLSYTWNPGNLNGNNVIVAPGSNTTYTVLGTDANGCSNTSTITLNVSACTGVVKLNGENISYHIFPNPAKELVTIELFANTEMNVAIEVLDIQGKLIKKQTLIYSKERKSHQIDVTTISKGMYFINISDDKGESKLIKLIKE